MIRYSKAKVVGLALLTLPFIALFAYVIVYPDRPDSRYPADLMRPVGVLGVIGLVALLLYYIAKLFDREPGLVVDREGFIDRTTFISVGRVNWADVRGLRTMTRRRSKTLIVEVHDPLRFVDRGNILQRLIRAPDYWLLHLSPVRLRSVMLDTDFDGLVWAVTSFWNEAKPGDGATLSSGRGGV